MGMSSKDIARLRRGFKRAPTTMATAARKGLTDVANAWRNKMILEKFRPFENRQNPGEILQSRSGFLKKSLGTRTVGTTLADLGAVMFSSGIRYAKIHEYGGDIKPKTKKFLTIPLDAAMGKRGIPKRNSIRDYSEKDVNYFFYRDEKNTLFFAMSKTKGRGKNKTTEVIPLFVLKRLVKMPARLGMRSTFAALEPQRRATLQNALVSGLAKALRQEGTAGG